jgi:hypothetical protein
MFMIVPVMVSVPVRGYLQESYPALPTDLPAVPPDSLSPPRRLSNFGTSCSADCPTEITSTFGDQTAFCALDSTDDTSCLDDCSLSPARTDAHCACSTGGLFYSYSFDLGGSPYCCGDETCKSAILNAYVEDSPTQTEAEHLAALEASCASVGTCDGPSQSYEYGCTADCSAEFTTAYEAQDNAALCELGSSACLDDCGHLGAILDSHCAVRCCLFQLLSIPSHYSSYYTCPHFTACHGF